MLRYDCQTIADPVGRHINGLFAKDRFASFCSRVDQVIMRCCWCADNNRVNIVARHDSINRAHIRAQIISKDLRRVWIGIGHSRHAGPRHGFDRAGVDLTNPPAAKNCNIQHRLSFCAAKRLQHMYGCGNDGVVCFFKNGIAVKSAWVTVHRRPHRRAKRHAQFSPDVKFTNL